MTAFLARLDSASGPKHPRLLCLKEPGRSIRNGTFLKWGALVGRRDPRPRTPFPRHPVGRRDPSPGLCCKQQRLKTVVTAWIPLARNDGERGAWIPLTRNDEEEETATAPVIPAALPVIPSAFPVIPSADGIQAPAFVVNSNGSKRSSRLGFRSRGMTGGGGKNSPPSTELDGPLLFIVAGYYVSSRRRSTNVMPRPMAMASSTKGHSGVSPVPGEEPPPLPPPPTPGMELGCATWVAAGAADGAGVLLPIFWDGGGAELSGGRVPSVGMGSSRSPLTVSPA